MELVYLWVEKHKNIYKQGFNFSPRFQCTYDNVSEKLVIDKKNNYVNIFPNNINVSVIAGENGSGKSSILELLFARYNEEKILLVFYSKEKNAFLLTGSKKNVTVSIKDKSLRNIQINHIECLPSTKAIYYSNILNKNDLYLQEFLVPITYTHTVNISTSHLLSQMKLIEANLLNAWNKSVTGFDKIYRSFEVQQIQNAIILIQDKVVQIPFELPEKLIIKNINFKSFIENAKNKFDDKNYKKILDVIEKSNDSKTIFKNYLSTNLIISLLLENINSNNPILQELLDIVLNQKMTNYLEDFYTNVKERLYKHRFMLNNELITASYIDDFFDLADKILSILDSLNYNETNSYLLELNINKTDFTFLKYYEKLIQQSEYFWDITWRGLSSGEESYLYQFSRFYNLKNNFKTDPYKNLIVGQGTAENLIWLIDEGELTLHPQWQKQYINYLIQFFNKNFTQNIHIILTSHSPFILSDLPKENVIFLEKYIKDEDINQEEGNCKNATKEIEIKTFGANIHTLLSHGFFMKDGLMGEFAEKTIQDVINYLDDKPTQNMNKQKAWQIIQFVGEPFLKYKLEEKYNGKFLTEEEKKQNKIKQLEDELKRLKDDNTQS
ncbi:AAA family ATPase [Aliarcobacter butzleri]